MKRRYVMMKANEYDQIMELFDELRWMLESRVDGEHICYEELKLVYKVEELLEGDDEE